MKKFTKVCLIIAGILFTVGLMITLIAIAFGARPAVIGQNSMVAQKLERAVFNFIPWGWDDSYDYDYDYNYDFDYDEDWKEEWKEEWNDGWTGGYTNQLIINGKVVEQNHISNFDAAEIANLELSIALGTVEVYQREDDKDLIEIYTSGMGRCNYRTKNNTLYIEGFDDNYHNKDYDSNEMTILIPRERSFLKIDSDIGVGTVTMTGIDCTELDVEVGAGRLYINDAVINEIDVESAAGEIYMEGTQVSNGNILASAGSVFYSGVITGNLKAECAMGSIELDLRGRETDHNYDIETAMGSISIGDSWSVNVASEKYISNGAGSTLELTCGMGEITVNFEE